MTLSATLGYRYQRNDNPLILRVCASLSDGACMQGLDLLSKFSQGDKMTKVTISNESDVHAGQTLVKGKSR